MIEYLEMFYGLKRSARGLKKMGAVDFATTLAPGLRDVLLTGKVKEAVTRVNDNGRPAYDAVVLDAPPTGRIRQFLDATREVANLTKFGPINRQSDGRHRGPARPADRGAHRHPARGDAGPGDRRRRAELSAAGFALGDRRRQPRPPDPDRRRPGRPGRLGRPRRCSPPACARRTLPDGYAGALAAQMADYAQRQETAGRDTTRRWTKSTLPRVELPDLNPPVELGELNELAALLPRRRRRMSGPARARPASRWSTTRRRASSSPAAAAGSARRRPRRRWHCSAPRPAGAPSCSPSTRRGGWPSRWGCPSSTTPRARSKGVENGQLFAMMLDMKRTFDDVVLEHSTPDRAEQIFANPFYQSLSSSFAGTQEYMAMEKLGQLAAAARVGPDRRRHPAVAVRAGLPGRPEPARAGSSTAG